MNISSKKSSIVIATFGSSFLVPILASADVVDMPTVEQQLEPTQALVEVLQDKSSSLTQKMQRLKTDTSYAGKIDTLRKYAGKAGWFDAPSDNTFLAIMHAIVKPKDVNDNVLLGFEGTEKDAKDSITIDDNISDLITAVNNPKNAKIIDPYLHFKAVLGEVQTTATTDSLNYYKTFNFHAGNVQLDPSPIEYKLERYKADETYQSAVRSAAKTSKENGIIANMYYTSYPYLSSTYLQKDIKLNTLLPIIDDSDDKPGEFTPWDSSDTVRDNNVQAILNCRKDILPKNVPMDLESRATLYNQIDQCAVGLIDKVQSGDIEGIMSFDEYQFNANNIHLDPTPFAERMKRYESDETYKKAMKSYAEGLHNDVNNQIAQMYYGSYYQFMDAALNKNANWDKFKDLKDESDDGSKEFELNNNQSNVIDNNMQFVFDCRTNILPEKMPKNLGERGKLYNQVLSCAKDKTDEQYAPYQNYKDTIANDPLYADTDETDELSYDAYKLLKKAHTEDVTAEQLISVGLTAENDEINSLANNFNAVLECRAEQQNPNYETVHQCAGNKLDDIRSNYVAIQVALWAAGGLGVLGIGGAGAYARHRRKNPIKKH